jgi:molybdopterin synthase sulfur carrier subunit
MSITVKFFASLRESLNRDDCELPAENIATAADAWDVATEGQERPANTLIAINMEYAGPEQAVKDGDEVAFFPPVTGG